MTNAQLLTIGLIAVMFVLFVWERWRYDVIAFGGLLAAVVIGVVPAGDAFSGFGHPATVTVAFVLILSQAMSNVGVSDALARSIRPLLLTPVLHVAALCGVAAFLSAFMNNVGALALMMPVALQSARNARIPVSALMMPLAFATILGGLTTLIGTPPNIIIAAYRAETAAALPFAMFDFTPVGLLVTLVSLAFIGAVGWRLIPKREGAGDVHGDVFHVNDYVFEVSVNETSPLVGQNMQALEDLMGDINALILRRERNGQMLPSVGRTTLFEAHDTMLVEAGPEALDRLMEKLGLSLSHAKQVAADRLRGDDAALMEAVVTPGSRLDGRTAAEIQLRRRHAVTLMAVSRQGVTRRGRLRAYPMRVGDVLLMYGAPDRLPEVARSLGCLPLAQRRVGPKRKRLLAFGVGIFTASIAAASFGWAALPVALGAAALAVVMAGLVTLRQLYQSVDWPVIVLLGAMIPVGHALEANGVTAQLAAWLATSGAAWGPAALLTTLLIITMAVSAVLNNAATAVIMAPIAAGLAADLGVSPDPFLMAVAVGASCAFLTPIGHQNNALVMGPGGYRFGDFWRLGLPLEILIIVVTVPLLLWIWPL